jgi:hypothetical protein
MLIHRIARENVLSDQERVAHEFLLKLRFIMNVDQRWSPCSCSGGLQGTLVGSGSAICSVTITVALREAFVRRGGHRAVVRSKPLSGRRVVAMNSQAMRRFFRWFGVRF